MSDIAGATIKIQGQEVFVPDRYKEGDTLNANEASALNQTFRENIRNNCASTFKEVEDPESSMTMDEAMEKVKKYIDEYEFGQAGGARLTPVEREARAIARANVLDTIANRPELVQGLDKAAKEAKIREWTELNRTKPAFIKAAQKIIKLKEAPAEGHELEL